jgi:hypothetical protein
VKWTEVLVYRWTEQGEGDRMVRGVRVAGVGRGRWWEWTVGDEELDRGGGRGETRGKGKGEGGEKQGGLRR